MRLLAERVQESPVDCAQVSPEELFARAASGDRPALDRLVADWKDPAYRVARCLCKSPALAEEAVQDAFIKLLARKAQFHDRGPGSFRSWFLTLLTNSARMAQRSERRAKNKETVDPRDYLNRRRSERRKDIPDGEELKEALERALDAIEERWRTPVVLHFVEGLRQKDIAPLLGVSQQIISLRIEQGLKLLRERLARMGLAAVLVPDLAGALGEAGIYSPPSVWGAGLAQAAASAPVAASTTESLRLWPGFLARSAKSAAWLLAAGFLAGLAVVATWAWNASTPAPAAGSQALATTQISPLDGPWVWDFNSGIPSDLVKLSGEWCWNPRGTINGSGAIEAPMDRMLRFQLPEDLPSEIVVGMRMTLGEKTYGRSFGFVTPCEGATPDSHRSCLFEPIERLDEKGSHHFEVLFNRADGALRMALDGAPFSVRECLAGKKPLPHPPLGFILAGAELDDLTVRSVTRADRERWARWLLERESFQVIKDFECPNFRNFDLWGVKYSGPAAHAPGKGIAGSSGMECRGAKANPVLFCVPAADGRGRQVLRFRWRPLEEQAARRSALQFIPGFLKDPRVEALLQEFKSLPARPAPSRLDPEAKVNMDDSQPLALQRWHEVAMVAGSQGSFALVDGRLFSVWTDPRALERFSYVVLRLEGYGILDDFRLNLSPESETHEELLRRLAAPEPLPAASAPRLETAQ